MRTPEQYQTEILNAYFFICDKMNNIREVLCASHLDDDEINEVGKELHKIENTLYHLLIIEDDEKRLAEIERNIENEF
jgi:hypothetical protein